MKRIFALLLALMLVFSLVGCVPTEAPATESPTVESVNTEPSFEEIVVVDNEYVAVFITSKPYVSDGYGQMIDIRLENKSSTDVQFVIDYIAANGSMMNAPFQSIVFEGKVDNNTIVFLDSDLNDNNIVEITEIEFALDVYDTETYAECFVSDVYTVIFTD